MMYTRLPRVHLHINLPRGTLAWCIAFPNYIVYIMVSNTWLKDSSCWWHIGQFVLTRLIPLCSRLSLVGILSNIALQIMCAPFGEFQCPISCCIELPRHLLLSVLEPFLLTSTTTYLSKIMPPKRWFYVLIFRSQSHSTAIFFGQ